MAREFTVQEFTVQEFTVQDPKIHPRGRYNEHIDKFLYHVMSN